MDASTVERVVSELLLLKDKVPREKLDELYLDFRARNRMLYETVLAGEHNPEIFNQMMKMKRRLEAGEDQYSVDVKFGQYMAEKYIDPLTKKS